MKSPSLAMSILVVFFASSAFAEGVGRLATPDEITAWDIDIRPDGVGLPIGSGSVSDGETLFEELCAACHGDFGEGVDRWPPLAGGVDTLASERPLKTVGSFWPYLSTVWDYVNRAMPFGDAQSLSANEVYAITAYIMYLNEVVDDESFVLTQSNFLKHPLRNEANFYSDDRPETEYPFFTEACMFDCKEHVEITKYASGKDVTPE